ncbi:hypothetical protein MBM_05202 [Drepanopeziza brunnea f. sp. 'multigermtubi' MB_m1]|uniref:Secreted protein n=1 Tax=Marssonina brunnea f. sp. multigermtubi (strain MB_m1) TaxID=1072389 RepID=K1X7W7_MARBU|nr:uncharacterized protein MBM_05202 [Drepanopeziza brunnea f. sp. 'multigermtubi' MB_m1]EKD16733.1 hypothetical protein MBM_05202 [Drepanopeziza brunnea f. sp. 'multigermtubi' MB_m1]
MQVTILTLLNLMLLMVFSPLTHVAALAIPAELSSSLDGMGQNLEMEGYKMGTMTFNGTYTGLPGTIVASGSFEEIIAQVQKDHPHLNKRSVKTGRAESVKLAPDISVGSLAPQIFLGALSSQQSANRYYSQGLFCDNKARAWNNNIRKAIAVIRGANGLCYADPHTCVKVICSSGTNIVYCNDSDYGLEADCTFFADSAEAIIRGCNSNGWTAGKLTDYDQHYSLQVSVSFCI